ncbi:MAG: hypothetical protein ACI4EI_05325 [Muricoprocola sp.]
MGENVNEQELQEIKGLASKYCKQAIEEKSETAMKQAIAYFEKAGQADTTGYFFLGNLYMPKINAPFPDDYEKAVSYFKKVSPETGEFYAKSMEAVGSYYYKEKKDYLYAAIYFSLAMKHVPSNRQYKNFYDLALSKVHDRKIWKACIDEIKDVSQIEEKVEKTKKKMKIQCPKCKSMDVEKVSFMHNLNKMLLIRLGEKRKYVTYRCKQCGKEW